MKYENKHKMFTLIIQLLIVMILITSSSRAFAQSKKVVRKPESTQTQTPNSEITLSKTDLISNSVIDASGDKYKIVFPLSFEGKLRFTEKEAVEMDQTRHSNLGNYLEQLNKAGDKGYRIISALSNYVALVKLDEFQYEYELFETISPYHFVKSGLQDKLEELSAKGFGIANHSFISQSCQNFISNDPLSGELCRYNDLFLFGKEKGIKKVPRQILVNSFPGWGAKPSVELEKQVNEKLGEGFYPVNALSQFEILLEQTKEEPLSDKPDVLVVRGDIEKTVNQLAKQGYRLTLVNNGIAVVSRPDKITTSVYYIWLDATKKNFEKQLAELQAKGAIYRMTYPNIRGVKNTLIFEQNSVDNNQQREYKVLKLELQRTENAAKQIVTTDLTQLSKETMKTLNQLAREGFEVRDLFVSDKVNFLLESQQVSVIMERLLN